MEGFFSFIDAVMEDREEDTKLPIPKEYAWNFKNNDFIFENGKPKVVEGLEAIEMWILKALNTPRYRYFAYSWDYGHELEELIGQGLSNEATKSEVNRYLKEALLINPYVVEIKDLKTNIEEDKITAEFTVITDYGQVKTYV